MTSYAPAGPGVESVYDYVEGGFHPVNIGDIFHYRYRVMKKLGFGSNSTIWLVEDVKLKRFASLKILAASTSIESSELSVSKYLQSQQKKNIAHPGREHVIQIFDTFVFQGPNGMHHCIVTELLGISLASEVHKFYGYGRNHFPEDINKKVAGQVALGVAYLHKCGVVHGDLNLANVLFYSPKLQNATFDDLDRVYGPPELRMIMCDDGTMAPRSRHLPRHLVGVDERLPLFEMFLSSGDDIQVKICDFGEATIINPNNHGVKTRPFKTEMDRAFAAPEIMLKDISSPTTSIDVWAIGVLLYMIINNKALPFSSKYGRDEEFIQSMLSVLGKPPHKLWIKISENAETFEDGGIHILEAIKKPPEGIVGIKNWRNYSQEECELFTRALRKIFCFDPEERVDAEEVVRLLPHGWVDPHALERLNGTAMEE